MKAIVYTEYGAFDRLKVTEVTKPVPGDNEILIKVIASSVNYATTALVRGKPFPVRFGFGLRKPKYIIPGGDVAGQVEMVGRNIKQFCPGDEVFGDLTHCGFGAYAEYVCVPENAIALKPANISFEEAAAAAQAAVVALQGLRDKGQVKPIQKVLIVGSSGGIGTFAVQIAKSFGAEVTGVCSTRNLDMVRSIGADDVIDYTQKDFVISNDRYDLILATAGYRSIFDYKRALKPTGICVVTGGALKQIFQAMLLGPLMSNRRGKRFCNVVHKVNQKDLIFVKELFEAKKIKTIIDRSYTLNQVDEALSYYEEGHSRGKVIITVLTKPD